MTRHILLASLIGMILLGTPDTKQLPAQDTPPAKEKAEKKTDDDEKKAKDEKSEIKTVEAELKPLVVYESFSGLIEPTRMHEVKTNFEKWSDLKIASRVEEGEVVTAGQEILKFETESIDKAVAEADFAAKNATFDLETAELEM